MNGLRLLGLLLRDVAADLFRHRGQNLLAVLTLASGLLLAGGGLLMVEGLGRMVSKMEAMAKVVVFASDGSNLDQAEASLRRDPRFISLRRVSAQENQSRFKELTREAGVLLQSAGPDALPESLELTLRPDLRQGHRPVEAGRSLKGLPGVGDVLVDHERLEALQKGAQLVRNALSTLGILLLLAAGLATGNVIRMTILAREEEIAIMRLVGASEAFIRTPLLLEGAALGLMASALALAGLWALWMPLNRGVGGLSPLLVEVARTGFFSATSILILATIGASTGALGALWGFLATVRAQRLAAQVEEGT